MVDVIQTNVPALEVVKTSNSLTVVQPSVTFVETTSGVRGTPGTNGADVTVQSRVLSSISGNTTAGTDATKDYWYTCTANLSLALPDPTGRTNSYHVDVQAGTVTITSSAIEDGTSLVIYANESVDLFPVAGQWRVF